MKHEFAIGKNIATEMVRLNTNMKNNEERVAGYEIARHLFLYEYIETYFPDTAKHMDAQRWIKHLYTILNGDNPHELEDCADYISRIVNGVALEKVQS